MSYVKLYDDFLDDEYFMDDCNALQRYVFLALLMHSAKDRGCIKTESTKMLSRRIGVAEHELIPCLSKFVSDGKIERIGCAHIIVNYSKYNTDPTNKDRQARFRERHLQTSSNASNGNNAKTPIPIPIPIPKKEKKVEKEKGKPTLPPQLESDLKTWDENRGDWPKCEDVPKHLIREHKACCLDTEFDLKAVMTKAQQSSFLAGKKFVTLFWMLKPDKTSGVRNYRRILNGEFDDPEQPTTQPKESQSDKAARQAEARARSDRILALSRGEKETP